MPIDWVANKSSHNLTMFPWYFCFLSLVPKKPWEVQVTSYYVLTDYFTWFISHSNQTFLFLSQALLFLFMFNMTGAVFSSCREWSALQVKKIVWFPPRYEDLRTYGSRKHMLHFLSACLWLEQNSGQKIIYRYVLDRDARLSLLILNYLFNIILMKVMRASMST